MGFDALISILAELYPTQADARRIIASARIDHRLVNFDGNALRYWHDIFVVANRQDKVFDLLDAAEGEYPDSAELENQIRRYDREIARLADRAAESSSVDPITDRRLGSLESSVDKLTQRQSEMRDKIHEMSGKMTMLINMVESLSSDRRPLRRPSATTAELSPWLFASLAAIAVLVVILTYILANGGA